MARPKQTSQRKQTKQRKERSRVRRRAGMPVRLGLTPRNPKHREPSRVGNHTARLPPRLPPLYHHHPKHSPPTPKVLSPSQAPEFPINKKSRGTQLLNRMKASMSSKERDELENRIKTLSVKHDLGLVDVKKI